MAIPSITKINCIWLSKTSATLVPRPSPQTNRIVERQHKTMLNEFYRVTFRAKIYESINVLQTDLDAWLNQYNNNGNIRDRDATARRPCAPSSMRCS